MTYIEIERDSPKEVDYKILSKGFEGLYYYTQLLVEIFFEVLTSDIRYMKVKGIPKLEIQKEKANKLKKLLEDLYSSREEFEWPEEKFSETWNIIFEEIYDIKSEIRKTSFKGSPPRLRNKIGFYWALFMHELKGIIDWELIAQLLEWTHLRFRGSVWKNLIISDKEPKSGNISDKTEALEKHFIRNKDKKPLFPVSGIIWTLLSDFPYSIHFNKKKGNIDFYAIGILEEAYYKNKEHYKSQFTKGLNPVIYKNRKIFLYEPNPPLLIFPDETKLYLIDHIDNVKRIN